MGVQIPSSTPEHSSRCSSGDSTATTESGAAGRLLTTLGLPVAIPDEAVTSWSASAQSASSRFKGVVPQPNGRWGAQIYDRHARVWIGTFPDEHAAARAYDVAALRYRGRDAATNFPRVAASTELAFLAAHSKAEIVDMLRNHTYADELRQGLRRDRGRGIGGRAEPTPSWAREPLFEKVLTPSDVGKLNRIVLPKQHAEKHFPLKRTPETTPTTDKDVLLNFEDCEGKVWRFRYSYWNSSQSYVLTKGWCRFVREKGLVAGDVVVFSCSEYGQEKKFFIDYKKTMTVTGGALASPPPGVETAKGEQARVVRLFGVDIAGEMRGLAAPVELE